MTVVPESRIPHDEAEYEELTKVFKCERWPGLKPAYVRDYTINKTLVFCSPPQNITGGYCPEWNNGNIQERYTAPCGNFPTPCPFKYNIWESYKYRDCLIKDSEGAQNHSSPESGEGKQNQTCPESGESKQNQTNEIILIVLIVFLMVSLFGNVVTLVLYCRRKKRDNASSSLSVETEGFAIDMQEHQENEENGIQNAQSDAPIQVTDDDDDDDDGNDGSIIDNRRKKETDEDGALNDQSEVQECESFLHDTYLESEVNEVESQDDNTIIEVL